MMFSSKAFTVGPKVKGRFQRGALIAWCFHPAGNNKRSNVIINAEFIPATAVRSWCVGDPAYILATVDELVYGYHSIFILIHLLLETEKSKWRRFSVASWTEQWLLSATNLPERILLRADEASPLWGQGMCISPSCRRWPSWCPAFPVTHRKGRACLFLEPAQGQNLPNTLVLWPNTCKINSFPRSLRCTTN